MKIVTFVDGRGHLAPLTATGVLRLYDHAGEGWRARRDVPFAVGDGLSLTDVKAAVRAAVAQLDGCRVLLSGAVRGLVYSLLQEENGFRVWQARGAPEPLLDQIARQDAELAEQRKKEAAEQAFAALFAGPSGGCGGGGCGGGGGRRRPGETLRAVQSLTESLGEGRYRIDLAAILAKYRNANSMDVLIPLLEGTRFRSLEILCDHLPRWFDGKLEELRLRAEIETRGEAGRNGGVRAVVSPRAEDGREAG